MGPWGRIKSIGPRLRPASVLGVYFGPRKPCVVLPLSGGPAIAMGIAWLGCALALAGAYLLGRLDTYWRVAPIAVFAGCTLVVLGWGYALVWAIATVFA